MSKITKKQLHNGWHCHDMEIVKMKKELRELKRSVLRLEKLTDEKLPDEPPLKQLDQSIFDGLDAKWRFAAVPADGKALYFSKRPHDSNDITGHFIFIGDYKASLCGEGYDTSNWQKSLIERDIAKELLEIDLSSELTGSDLCRKMLERGDKFVMCLDGGKILNPVIIGHIDKDTGCFVRKGGGFIENVTPINNQGEPLTAADVGL